MSNPLYLPLLQCTVQLCRPKRGGPDGSKTPGNKQIVMLKLQSRYY